MSGESGWTFSCGCQVFNQNNKHRRSKMNSILFRSGSARKAWNVHRAGASLSSAFQPDQLIRFVLVAIAMIVLIVAVTSTAQALAFSVLYNFGTTGTAGANPSNPGILAQGCDGNMYGTTVNGGTNGVGTVFQITPAGTLTVIYNFNETQGYAPYGGLTLGTNCTLYGSAAFGGTAGLGMLFKITTSGGLTVLYDFTGGKDGRYPMVPPILGTDGNWYGTTQGDFSNFGSIYTLTSTGKLTPIYTFVGSQGSEQSRSPLVLATDGNFYGTTADGGVNNEGMVYKISPAGKLKVLFSFDSVHGAVALAPMIQATDGSLYGTASVGGSNGAGVVFKLPLAGKLSVLYNVAGGTGPSNPYGGLVQAMDGNFYGTTYQGGAMSDGDIFRISTKGDVSSLFDFDANNGSRPEGTLLQHTNGILYGDTFEGGSSIPACGNSGCGVFFSWNEGLKPCVSLLAPFRSGKIGDTIYILGQGFTGTTGVSFDGVAATFTIVTDNYLTATVPTGAKTGSVTVKTPGGALTSNKAYLVTPMIKTFSPSSGKVGTSVTITGQSLLQTTKVSFGLAKATFTVNSDTQITATVPAGAKTGKITITTPGGKVTSSGTFTVTQ